MHAYLKIKNELTFQCQDLKEKLKEEVENYFFNNNTNFLLYKKIIENQGILFVEIKIDHLVDIIDASKYKNAPARVKNIRSYIQKIPERIHLAIYQYQKIIVIQNKMAKIDEIIKERDDIFPDQFDHIIAINREIRVSLNEKKQDGQFRYILKLFRPAPILEHEKQSQGIAFRTVFK